MNQPLPTELLTLRAKHDTGDSISIAKMMIDIRDFGLLTFDYLDKNGNGFLSKDELEHALAYNGLKCRQYSYVKFMLVNLEKISKSFDDGDEMSSSGISRSDLLTGISRIDLEEFFNEYLTPE